MTYRSDKKRASELLAEGGFERWEYGISRGVVHFVGSGIEKALERKSELVRRGFTVFEYRRSGELKVKAVLR